VDRLTFQVKKTVIWKISYLRSPISDEDQQVPGLFPIFFGGAVSSDAVPTKLIYAVPSVIFFWRSNHGE
jgi:hypothetical protein